MTSISHTNETPTPESSPFLSLSAELRLQIYHHLVIARHPFFIGRCQEKTRKKYRKHRSTTIGRSPRDSLCSRRLKYPPPIRDDSKECRPVQPPITRVSRLIRKEAIPIFYAENEFWLIHNEFSPRKECNPLFRDRNSPYYKAQGGLYPPAFDPSSPWPPSSNSVPPTTSSSPSPPRAFSHWLSQTPPSLISQIQSVSLCGYGATWPNRYRIILNLKTLKLLSVRYYTTYGEEPRHGPEIESRLRVEIQEVLDQETKKEEEQKKKGRDGFGILMELLKRLDWMFEIMEWQEDDIPEGYEEDRPLGEGWEFEW
ncbi:hypothetical protein CKM354_000008000 [Cercospora kikuchii]|uniref:Uncharacterized protein n=1 Tax=Cercospora kikuchii TaxID=84275 RepID=A0A9P3CAK1_9PEZI|nr:uncharacterized protein CKM354_000008000 [Cercospora kikuchii]GIZ36610.1 hypothetical protein CKM354_000008000 [Cercospora kikuchii]